MLPLPLTGSYNPLLLLIFLSSRLFTNGHGIIPNAHTFYTINANGVRPNQASSNADAPTYSPKDGVTVLAKPHEESQMFDDFLTYLTQQEMDETFPEDSEVRYAQTRQSLCLPILPAILPFQAGGSTTSSHDRRLMCEGYQKMTILETSTLACSQTPRKTFHSPASHFRGVLTQ
jgi:hypothetical protein